MVYTFVYTLMLRFYDIKCEKLHSEGFMRTGSALLLAAGLMLSTTVFSYDIGLVPLHEFSEQEGKSFGRNVSLHGTPTQIAKIRRWLAEIAEVPKGIQTLQSIETSGHKLMIFHSNESMTSSGKASAPLSSNLTNGRGESVDIYFNFNIPDNGSHRVFDTRRSPIEYTAIQNLYHELAHAMHMMNGTWRYARSERQAIEEENVFRRQHAELKGAPFFERVYVSGIPICPLYSNQIDESWRQDIICF